MTVETQADVKDIVQKIAEKRYKMRVRETQYNVDWGGRIPGGAVVLVDENTAIRLYEKNVADPAAPDAPTFAEEVRRVKRDEFLARARPAEGVYDQAITRGSFDDQPQDARPLMREMPRRPRRRAASDPLAGAEVVTDVDDDDGD